MMRLPWVNWARNAGSRFYSTGGPAKPSSNDIVHKLLNDSDPSSSFRRRPGSLDSLASIVTGNRGGARSRFVDEYVGKAVTDPPRTGVYAGRSVAVNQPEDLPRALAHLNQLNRVNNIQRIKRLQMYHEAPAKANWRIKMARRRLKMRMKLKQLFHMALQAEKRGL